MSDVWVIVTAVAAGTFVLKGAGPVLLGGRPLPEGVTSVVALLAPALLGALVAVQAFGDGRALAADARVLGVAVAAIAIWRRLPLLIVVILAAVVTALVRLIG
jgi:uncharacterized membrane protein